VKVTWQDAADFCAWAGAALPSEVQWENAARCTDGRTYPWGEEPPTDERCNWAENAASGGDAPLDVRSCPQGLSPYGVFDMAGNVREWCADRMDAAHEDRACRGGGFNSTARTLRASCRGKYPPDTRSASLGFRVVLDRRGE
jgi:formylglycine-generating enzyme required for sulfatase activity